mmetsp:Transcript_51916/g.127444  ORF Transcript_51916/g.127444 Transcript_51916/m.127444 type:complete len:189 (+) Transcript_51916:86-652(+)
MSRGNAENDVLKANVEDQLNRLLSQLEDLEELKDDLDDDEYEETKRDTLAQLAEFDASLKKMMSGNVGLVTELASVQLAIQGAISKAYSTPEVIRMFAKGENGQLRERLANLQRDEKLGKISRDAYTAQAVEVLSALKRLGEELSPPDDAFLSANKTQALAAFEEARDGAGGAAAVKGAAKQVQAKTS